MNENKRNSGLDELRALAIILVVISHLFNLLDPVGVYGVELFFVLSGFLIGGILITSVEAQTQNNLKALSGFWVRRWLRTLPNYYWFMALYLIDWFVRINSRGPAPRGLLFFFIFLQNFAWPTVSPFFGVTWSLAVEEWFYLLFPAALYMRLRLRHSIPSTFLYSMLLFLLVPQALRLVSAWLFPYVVSRFIVVLRMDAMMYGVALAFVRTWHFGAWAWLSKAWPVGIFGLALGGYLMTCSSPVLRAMTFTALPLSFFFILPCFHNFPGRGNWTDRIIRKTSLWSYSIYLCHILVYNNMKALLAYDHSEAFGRFVIKVTSLLLIVAMAALNYRYIEQPFTNLRDRLRRKELADLRRWHDETVRNKS